MVTSFTMHAAGDLRMEPFTLRTYARLLAARPGMGPCGGRYTTEFNLPCCTRPAAVEFAMNSTSPICIPVCPEGPALILGMPLASLAAPLARVISAGYLLKRQTAPAMTAMTAEPRRTAGKALASKGTPLKDRNINNGGATPNSVARTLEAPTAWERLARFKDSTSCSVRGLS